jgi:hypothetical protein
VQLSAQLTAGNIRKKYCSEELALSMQHQDRDQEVVKLAFLSAIPQGETNA